MGQRQKVKWLKRFLFFTESGIYAVGCSCINPVDYYTPVAMETLVGIRTMGPAKINSRRIPG